MGSPQSPTPKQYAELERSGQLAEIPPPKPSTAADGRTTVNFSLPRQGVTLLEFSLSNSGSAQP
jgi:xylan 1,4-beta-xylosidase